MREDRGSDDGSDLGRYLERESYADTVKKTVEREGAGASSTAMHMSRMPLFVVRVVKKEAVYDKVSGEPERGQREDGRRIIYPANQLKRFGQEIEERDRDYRAGAETEDEVQPVFQTKCKHPSDEGRRKGGDGY